MLTPAEVQLLTATVRRADQVTRVARLALAQETCLRPLLAHAAVNLTRTLMLLCGDEMRAQFLGWLTEQLRESQGLCPFCGQPKRERSDPMCQTCLDAVDAETRAADVHVLMGRPLNGPAN